MSGKECGEHCHQSACDRLPGPRNNADQYFTLAFFDSFESAMENSNSPKTQEMSQKMMGLADGPRPSIILDILDDREDGLTARPNSVPCHN